MFSSRSLNVRQLHAFKTRRWKSWHYLLLGFAVTIFGLHIFWDGTHSNSRTYDTSSSYTRLFFGQNSRNVKKGKQFGIATQSKPSRPPVHGYVLVDPDVDLSKKSTKIELDDLLRAVDAATTTSYHHHQIGTTPEKQTTTTTEASSIHHNISSETLKPLKPKPSQPTTSKTKTGATATPTANPATHDHIIASKDNDTANGKNIPLAKKYPTCKIYVVDPDAELSASIGLPHCNINKVWPFNEPGTGVEGMNATPHWAAQHASGYWLAKSIQSSFASSNDINAADIIYVNTHCYSTWYASTRYQAQRQSVPFQPINDAAITVSRLFIEGIMAMKQFTRTAGRRYAISRPVLGSPPGAMMDTCAKLKRSFIVASERGVFCDNDRDRAAKGNSLIVPYVVVEHVNVTSIGDDSSAGRSMLVTYRGDCAVESVSSPAAMMIASMIAELEGLKAEKESVNIACDKIDLSLEETLQAMRSSTFCVVVPSASHQATRALPAAVLSGCIPVFFGAPFHALPLAHDVKYRSVAVLFNITESGRWQPKQEQGVEEPHTPGDLEPMSNLEGAVVSVPTFRAAVEYLKGIPPATIAAMQAMLKKESPKFYYPPWPGSKESALGRIAVERMCQYAARLNGMLAARDAARAENPHADMNVLPKLTKGELKKMETHGDDESIAAIG